MANEKEQKPIVDTKNKKINQIGIVVKDAHKTAKKYSETLGIGPWIFFDLSATDVIFRNRKIGDGKSMVRIAMANLGRIQIELLQPLYGEGTHADFLKERGEGVFGLSVFVSDFDAEVKALREKGIIIEDDYQASVHPGYPFRIAWIPPEEGHGVWIELVDAEALPPGIG